MPGDIFLMAGQNHNAEVNILLLNGPTQLGMPMVGEDNLAGVFDAIINPLTRLGMTQQ